MASKHKILSAVVFSHLKHGSDSISLSDFWFLFHTCKTIPYRRNINQAVSLAAFFTSCRTWQGNVIILPANRTLKIGNIIGRFLIAEKRNISNCQFHIFLHRLSGKITKVQVSSAQPIWRDGFRIQTRRLHFIRLAKHRLRVTRLPRKKIPPPAQQKKGNLHTKTFTISEF